MGFKTTLVAEIESEYERSDSKVYAPFKLHCIVSMPKAKNWNLQTNRLICHSFHGCWQNTRDSWIRDRGYFITHRNRNSQNIIIFHVSVPQGPPPPRWHKEAQVTRAHAVGCVTEEETSVFLIIQISYNGW